MYHFFSKKCFNQQDKTHFYYTSNHIKIFVMLFKVIEIKE